MWQVPDAPSALGTQIDKVAQRVPGSLAPGRSLPIQRSQTFRVRLGLGKEFASSRYHPKNREIWETLSNKFGLEAKSNSYSRKSDLSKLPNPAVSELRPEPDQVPRLQRRCCSTIGPQRTTPRRTCTVINSPLTLTVLMSLRARIHSSVSQNLRIIKKHFGVLYTHGKISSLEGEMT